MTNADFDRLNVLCDKMVAAQQAAGREFSDTADLTPMEQSEYRALMLKMEDAYPEEDLAVLHVAGEDDGRIGVQSDAAW